jgi:hypothetical protein
MKACHSIASFKRDLGWLKGIVGREFEAKEAGEVMIGRVFRAEDKSATEADVGIISSVKIPEGARVPTALISARILCW